MSGRHRRPQVSEPPPEELLLRAEQQRRARQRRAGIGALMAAALVAVVAVLLWAASRGADEAGEGTGPRILQSQQVALLQLRGDSGRAEASVLLGSQPVTGRTAGLLVPSRLVVSVPGAGSMPFGEVSTLPGESGSADALTDLLGVRVDGSWVLDRAALATLVDAAGGVDVDVDADVVVERDGSSVVVVAAGAQRLDGDQAAAYATYAGEGEPEQMRLARFGEVLTQLLRGLPGDEEALAELLARPGVTESSTLPDEELVELLGNLRSDVLAGRSSFQQLPVRSIDTGAEQASFSLDDEAAAAVLDELFAGPSRTGTGDDVRVLVENAVRTPGLVEGARSLLVAEGYRFVNGGNAEQSALPRSVVLIPDLTTRSVTTGRAVARTLGLPGSAVRVSQRGQSVADVIVLLGEDFAP